MPMPGDFAERVYAGVVDKIIGVYLGRSVEGWDHERIISELGKIYYYVNDRWQPEADIRRIPTIGEVAEFPTFPPFRNKGAASLLACPWKPCRGAATE